MQLSHPLPRFALLALLMLQTNCITHGLTDLKGNPFAIEHRSEISHPDHPSLHQRLVAARSTSGSELRRDVLNGFLKHDHVLHFVEDDSSLARRPLWPPQLPFAAHVRLSSHLPTLLLEDHDAHLENIACYGSNIEIKFHSSAAVSAAWQEMQPHPAMLVITSHLGCNAGGERRPFLVSRVKRDEKSLFLSVSSTSFRKSFHSIDVEFGSRSENVHLERNEWLRKRQNVEMATSHAATSPSSIAYPSRPSASPSETSVLGANLEMSWINTTILPPSFPGVNISSLGTSSFPLGLSFGCRNCTLQGTVDLTHGKFTVNAPTNISNIGEKIRDTFDPGFIKLAVNFATHIELESKILASDALASYTTSFPDITIPGFSIPGIAEVGPALRPNLNIGVRSPIGLNFTYGFALDIPSNSSVFLDIGDPIKSNVTGFQQTQISALPFQTNLDELNLTVWAAFNPQLLLTIGLLENDLGLSAGAFLDLPKLEATVAKVRHVDKRCNPVNATDHIEDYLFDSLTNILPTIELDVGVLADAHAKIGKLSAEAGVTHTFASTVYTLPTACISFDALKKAYVVPSQTKSDGLPSATATKGPGSKSESNSLRQSPTLPSGVPFYLAIVLFFWALCMA